MTQTTAEARAEKIVAKRSATPTLAEPAARSLSPELQGKLTELAAIHREGEEVLNEYHLLNASDIPDSATEFNIRSFYLFDMLDVIDLLGLTPKQLERL